MLEHGLIRLKSLLIATLQIERACSIERYTREQVTRWELALKLLPLDPGLLKLTESQIRVPRLQETVLSVLSPWSVLKRCTIRVNGRSKATTLSAQVTKIYKAGVAPGVQRKATAALVKAPLCTHRISKGIPVDHSCPPGTIGTPASCVIGKPSVG